MTSARGSRASLVLSSLVITCIGLNAAAAHAEPSAEDLASARDLFKEGRALRERGDLPKALEKFRAAHALGQTPITGIELARTYVLLGKLVEGHEASVGVARLPVASDETARSANARADAAALARELEPQLAHVIVTVKGVPPGSEARISVDEETIPTASIGEPRAANPGRHLVVLTSANGTETILAVDLREGESRAVVLEATRPAPPIASHEDVLVPAPPPPAHRRNALIVTGAVVGGLGAVVGTAFGIATLDARHSLDRDCLDGLCPPPYHSELEHARTDGTVSTIAFAVAGAGLGAAILGLFVHPSARDGHVSVVPVLGAGWLGAHGAF